MLGLMNNGELWKNKKGPKKKKKKGYKLSVVNGENSRPIP